MDYFVSLVRSIRVQDTLDLPNHLVDDDDDDDSRWPLHPDDINVPEWSLHDEIQAFAKSIAPASDSDDLAGAQARENEALEPIPDLVADFMSFILTMVAHHTPERTDGLQNRMEPIGWQDVVSVLAGGIHGTHRGVVNSDMLGRVQERLEELYGPAEGEIRFIDKPVHLQPKKYVNLLIENQQLADKVTARLSDGLPELPPSTYDMKRCQRLRIAERGRIRAESDTESYQSWSDRSPSESEGEYEIPARTLKRRRSVRTSSVSDDSEEERRATCQTYKPNSGWASSSDDRSENDNEEEEIDAKSPPSQISQGLLSTSSDNEDE